MGDVSMINAIGDIRSYFRAETGDWPTSVRMHYDDWYKLMSEMRSYCAYHSDPRQRPRFMNMVPLLDSKWPKGFPVCLSAQGASIAISEGARAA